jgi:hypothetical protein
VIAIACSQEASFALVEPNPGEREVLAWDRNNGGQLGTGQFPPALERSSLPVRVIGLPQPIFSLYAGKYYGHVIAGDERNRFA